MTAPDSTTSASQEAVAAAARLQAIRDARFPGMQPVANAGPRGGRSKLPPRRDPSLRAMLAQPARDARVRALALAQASAAIRAALSRDIADEVVPISHFRGVLTLAAANASVRFHLDRQLRAGGERAILTMLRSPTHRVRVVIGTAPPVIPDAPRAQRDETETADD